MRVEHARFYSRMLRPDLAEQSVILQVPVARNTRRKVKRVQAAAVTAVSEDQAPEPGKLSTARWLA